MSPSLTPEEELAALARLLAHPVRVKILHLLHDQDASASDLTPAIGEQLSAVSYHFKLLAEAGALELKGTKQVRGALERTYGITPATRKELDGMLEWLDKRKRRSGRRASATARKRAAKPRAR